MLLMGLVALRGMAQTGIAVPQLSHCDVSMQQFILLAEFGPNRHRRAGAGPLR